MLAETLLAITLGVLFGIFTGLTPGIHVNLISLLVVAFSGMLLELVTPLTLCVFIISLAITHTFIDSIPSIYLGAPDESMALSALPGHRMLLAGRGHEAVLLTIMGSSLALLTAILVSPFLIQAFSFLYTHIKDYIGHLLIVLMVFLILRSGKILLSAIFFLTAGILGLIALNLPNVEHVLLPLLSGLFGVSILLISLKDNNTVPEQSLTDPDVKLAKPVLGATAVAAVASFLPGFGSSQSAIVAQSILGDIGDKGFLVLTGGINTVNMALSLITLYSIDKARNGAIVAVSSMLESVSAAELATFFSALLISSGCAILIGIYLSRVFSIFIPKVNYRLLVLTIVAFITVLVVVLSGWIGLVILVVSASIGMLASLFKVGKNNLMGCLIVPVILFFI